MSWANALVDYAKTPDPAGKLAKDVYLTHTDRTLTIHDKFPKAMFHFLCLPRLPYTAPSTETAIPASTLSSLSNLVSSKRALEVLKDMKEASHEVQMRDRGEASTEADALHQVVEQIEEEMLAKEGFKWPISVGFHPIESMAHVHLCVDHHLERGRLTVRTGTSSRKTSSQRLSRTRSIGIRFVPITVSSSSGRLTWR